MNPKRREHVFSRDAIRELDRRAIEDYHIPGIVLMENAARGLADHALSILPRDGRVLIICGGGNNGGDGLAAARHLHNMGANLTIALTKPEDTYRGDSATNLRICRAMRLEIVQISADPVRALPSLPKADLILDGLLGTGLTAEVRQPLTDVIAWINDQPVPILAIDIPSGLDCDAGEPLGAAVRAMATVTFVGLKRGFLNPDSLKHTGEIHVADIGVPNELIAALCDN